ncbi:Klhl18 [Symbiodinium natans]|uniref:Klhl18 protein n=1 Tax=Symbiodinium natans TaxID=878477 RepID=A0A812JKT0_9DINO|nr:Klhl18 [Symbiodinium natans]
MLPAARGCNTYERVEIERWLETTTEPRDPYSNIPLRSKDLRENTNLREGIREWSAQNAEHVKQMADLQRQLRDAQLALETARKHVPKRFVCGLSKQVMKRPIRARDENLYDETAFQEYVRLSETSGQLVSPVTEKPMEPGYDHEAELEEEIRRFLKENFPAKEPAWRQSVVKTADDAPAEWPALMSTRTFAKQAAMTEAAFHGSVSFEEGSEIKTVVSFPGQYQEDWQCLVRRSVKRSAFEKDATEDPGQPCRHYVSGSTACVFLPQGSKFFGGHVPNEDGTSDVCWCQDLYEKKQSFGCRWFEEWRLRLQTAVERKHTLVVVYKAGQKGVGRVGLAWPPRIECSAARRGDAGLGVSQRGEVAWLLRHGLAFEEEDIDDYRRRLAADIKLELKELQSPLPSLRASWPIFVSSFCRPENFKKAFVPFPQAEHAEDMQPQFMAHLDLELDGLRDRIADDSHALDDQGSLHRLSVLFSALDELNDVLVATLGSWRAPFLVVFGAESVGKSSLLQRLSLLPFFPTDKSRCTRMPVRLEIRRTATPHPATMQVWNVVEQKWDGPARSISLEVSESQIHGEMNKLVEEAAGGGEFCLDKEIHIKASSTTLPPMNLVDLPGLVQADAALATQTQQLLQRYTQDSQEQDIFLAIVPASEAPANWAVMQLIKDRHLEERTIGVITKFDRLGEDEHEDLFPILRGEQVKGLVPLSQHGFVAVANVTKKREPGESFTEWMARKAQLEKDKFAIDLEMKPFVEKQQATIGAVVHSISRGYSWHVAHNWLPLTAKRLLAVWTGCCEELLKMGLPFASGQLEGAALAKFKDAATRELKRRLGFVVKRAHELFWSAAAKPVQDYLKKQLEALACQEVKLLDRQELPTFFETACEDIVAKLPPLETFASGLLEEALAALGPQEEDAFRLERLPCLVEELQKKLREAQPRLDVEKARDGISKVLRSAFFEQKHLKMEAGQDKTVKVSFDAEMLAARFDGALVSAFEGFGSEKQIEVDVISPALEATQSVPEACLELRRQVFARMEKCAEALEKLVKTRASLAESLDSSSKALEPRSKVLQQWLLGEAVPLVCGAISGDSPSDQSFRSPACNFVTSVLSDMVEILAQTASEEFDVAAWHGPLISRKDLCPPMSATCCATAAALDGKIYVMGGVETGGRTVQVFDTASSSWGQGPTLSCDRELAAAAVVGDRIYVTGGVGNGGALSSMESWSPGSGEEGWSEGPDSGKGRSGHAAVGLEGKLVLLGGSDGRNFLNSVQSFDPSTQQWQELRPLHERRNGVAAAALGGKIYAVGGHDRYSIFSSVEVFDPANGSWGFGPSLGQARCSHKAAALSDGRLYVLGGDFSEALRSTEVFDPSRGCWAKGPELKHPRKMFTAAAWDGALYVLGGDGFSESQKSVEVLPNAEMRLKKAQAAVATRRLEEASDWVVRG